MYLIRLLIIGDAGVGKTSLLVRFHEDSFLNDQKTTIGVDYKAKEVDITGEKVKLQIWDTAGQERFRAMTSAFYSKAQGIIVAFDVTQESSFKAVANWLRDVNTYAPSQAVVILCANKVDLPKERWQVGLNEIAALADMHNVKVMNCSAATGENVKEIFYELGSMVLKSRRSHLKEIGDENTTNGKIDLRKSKATKKNCCRTM